MPPERNPSAPSPAHTGFADEAQPERSRSAARALLGMPTGETNGRPVASVQPRSPGVRSVSAFLPRTVEPGIDEWDALQDELWGETTGNVAPRTVTHAPHAATDEQAAHVSGSSQGGDHRGRPASTATLGDITSTPVEHGAQPHTPLARTSLTIPGLSTSKQIFPALADTKDTPVSVPTGTQSVTTTDQSQHNRQPAAPAPTLGAGAFNETLLTRLERLFSDTETRDQSAARTTRQFDRATPPRAAATDSPEVRRLDAANNALVQQLEQLRRTVGALAARLSSQEARNDNASQQQQRGKTAAPPVQRVVAVTPTTSGPRTPRAFWERRHLGRVHLRSLR